MNEDLRVCVCMNAHKYRHTCARALACEHIHTPTHTHTHTHKRTHTHTHTHTHTSPPPPPHTHTHTIKDIYSLRSSVRPDGPSAARTAIHGSTCLVSLGVTPSGTSPCDCLSVPGRGTFASASEQHAQCCRMLRIVF